MAPAQVAAVNGLDVAPPEGNRLLTELGYAVDDVIVITKATVDLDVEMG